ncbi:YeeE/YedE family protein [Undibacterium jejuense]|uniref:YeeE/YedE family protein n=1 Tax=Undibacterium jejuense TaxID=1344949 RepID=A0A923HCL7_9BURK|nr:YeeE/YedE family protein [Undibacterium jejuense]MBC3860545.1 YeeE/YedE family protein [Undibacterium jejuense]
MSIAWNVFTPWSALIGGVVIGLAAAALILLNGKVAGISGILAGVLKPFNRNGYWRISFLLGLLIAPIVYSCFAPLPILQIDASVGRLLIAGFLVGIGTRYGAGCTSGHGVCGLSRLSLRSLVATTTFMAAGFVTVFVIRHVLHS